MRKNLRSCGSGSRICAQHPLNQTFKFLRELNTLVVRERDFICILCQILRRFERNFCHEHGPKGNTSGPNVNRLTKVALFEHDFRSHVDGCAAFVRQLFVRVAQLFGDSKVNQFDGSVTIEQDIFWLDVSVNDVVLVQVLNALHDLFKNELCLLL